jgi:hypothetical protein
MERTRIGVIIRSFEAKALVALKYLVLAQNLQQESFEFEILPEPDEDPFLDQLDSKVPQNRQELEIEAKAFIKRYEQWLTSDALAYGLQCDMPDQVVFVTALRFTDRYYLIGQANWAILALGYWERSMAPPSVVEFALTLLSEVAIDTACGANLPSRHHATKGCAFDFNANLADARYKALAGHVCPTCERIVEKHATANTVRDSRLLLTRQWLGSTSDPMAPAAIAKKLGYDLFQTKGFKATPMERTIELLQEEWVATILAILRVVVPAALLTWLGIKISK